MTSPATPSRPRCPVCALPARTCVCALITVVPNEVELLVLQHPDEQHQAKGSARLLRLSLARCRVVVGEAFTADTLLALLGGNAAGAALLYPDDASAAPARAAPGLPTRLVVLDGTWRKSLRMLHANPLLQSLPRWAVAAAGPSRYAALRKARHGAQLSTLEAACAALGDIEGAPARYEPLLAAFDRFVAAGVARARARPPAWPQDRTG